MPMLSKVTSNRCRRRDRLAYLTRVTADQLPREWQARRGERAEVPEAAPDREANSGATK